MPGTPNIISNRAKRERHQYNRGIIRVNSENIYDSIFRHCIPFTNTQKKSFLQEELVYGHGKSILEIGCNSWHGWLQNMDIFPERINCINISDVEIKKGKGLQQDSILKPIFYVMDAHSMAFKECSFDVVFGSAILHHLDLKNVLPEIKRVLKPNGKFVFWEPLGINPVGKLVRFLTPGFRTKDEQPFRFKELSIAKKYFRIKIIPFEFFVPAAGILSAFLFRSPYNILTNTAYFIDRVLLKVLPPIKYFYRYMIIVGYTN